jgi:hypothetical protein
LFSPGNWYLLPVQQQLKIQPAVAHFQVGSERAVVLVFELSAQVPKLVEETAWVALSRWAAVAAWREN